MKKFDYEECMEKHNGEAITRDGRKAKVLHKINSAVTNYPIITIVYTEGEGEPYEEIATYTPNGEYAEGEIDSLDIFLPQETLKGWLNVYKDSKGFHYGSIHPEKCEANRRCNANRVACINLSKYNIPLE